MMFNKYRVKHKSRFIIFTVVMLAVHQQMYMRQLPFNLETHFGASLRDIWMILKIFVNSYMRSRN